MNKLFSYHPRFWLATLIGFASFFVLPASWTLVSRILVAWNLGVALFLVLIYLLMTRLTADLIQARYVDEDQSAPVILGVVVAAALISVAAIIEPLATLRHTAGVERIAHIALAGFTLVNSWVLVPTMFTMHYADLFYSAAEEERPLKFPNTAMPAFWDFAYFSFTIAAACQTSDVSTENLTIRKVVIVHTIVSFFFNLAVLGFAVNVSADDRCMSQVTAREGCG